MGLGILILMGNNERSRSIRLDLFGTFATDGALSVLGILTGSMTARWLFPAGRGALAAVLFWPQFLAGIGLLSLGDATTYRTGTAREKSAVILASSFWLALALSAIVTGAGFLAMPFFLGEARAHLVGLAQIYLLVFIPFNFVTLVLLASDQGKIYFARYNLLRLLVPVIYLTGLLILWTTKNVSVARVVAIDCAATVLVALTRLFAKEPILLMKPAWEETKTLLRIAARFHVASVLLFLASEADTFVCLLLWDDATLGRYAVALGIASSSLAVFSGTLQKVLFPHLAQIQDVAYRIKFLERSLLYSAALLAILLVLVGSLLPWMIPLLFGEAFRDTVFMTQLLLVAYFFIALKTIIIQILRGLGESRTSSISAALGLAVFLLAVLPLAKGLGVLGVGSALGLSNAIAVGYLVVHIQRKYPLAFRRRGKAAQPTDDGKRKLQVHVALLGARNHYALPRLLNEARMLGRLYTDLYTGNKIWIKWLLGDPDGKLPSEKVVSFDAFGLWYRWASRRARTIQSRERLYSKAAMGFTSRILRHGLQGADLLYSYNGPALELFTYAKQAGIPCILEQIHVSQRTACRLLKEESERWAGWEPGLDPRAPEGIMSRREQMEWQLADQILGGSSFALDGIAQQTSLQKKCRVVQYGIPLELFDPPGGNRFSAARQLRVLFAGDVCLRKGAPYLLEALRLLNSSSIEARFAGQIVVEPSRLRPYKKIATFLGPVSQNRMRELYGWADVLVAPSICEGSALVTYEALASGVPVIATPHTGSWVRDEVEGLIVPIRDIKTLAAAIERCARDSDFIQSCKENARKGRGRLGLPAYRERLIRALQEILAVHQMRVARL